MDLLMSISAPSYGGAAYVTAASFTTNTGFPVTNNLYACLDPDFVFFLSFPVPDPSLFANFQGTLTSTGTITGQTVHIPNIPALQCKPLHVQAAVIGTLGQLPVLTNALNLSIIQ
jgi:hypothetical protein